MSEPLHYRGQCKTTGCFHCSECGFGPLTSVVNRPRTTRDDAGYSFVTTTSMASLCQSCAGLS
jgi:hypothetical protein